MITKIYLDIDGVINSLSRNPPRQNTGWPGEWKQEIVTVDRERYFILWSVDLINFLNIIDTIENVEFIFLTTWEDSATTVFAPLVGLNALNWRILHPEHEDDIYDAKNWWKLTAIKNDLANNEFDQVIWIDDDIAFDPASQIWAENYEKDILVISPYSTHGITRKQISVIINFINNKI
jgi:hypothetical protein